MMPTQSSIARTLHDVGLAAWFGGSLMGVVGLNGASAEVADPHERAAVANAGWAKWNPVSAAAIVAHLLGGAQLVKTNVPRLVAQPQARWVNLAKAVLTVGSLGATAYTGVLGKQMIEAGDASIDDVASGDDRADEYPVADGVNPAPSTPDDVASVQRKLEAMQWVVPASTGVLLALNAKVGEQQRPSVVLRQAVRSGTPMLARAAVPVLRQVPWTGVLATVAGAWLLRRVADGDGGASGAEQSAGGSDAGLDGTVSVAGIAGSASVAGAAGANGSADDEGESRGGGRRGRRGRRDRGKGRRGRRGRRSRRNGQLTARDIMTDDVTCLAPGDTLEVAARRMVSLDVGALPICDADTALLGMVTDRDIVTRAVATGRTVTTTTVEQLTDDDVLTVDADDPVSQVVDAMAARNVRRVPVLDDGRLVGIVSQADVAATGDDAVTGQLVELISTDDA